MFPLHRLFGLIVLLYVTLFGGVGPSMALDTPSTVTSTYTEETASDIDPVPVSPKSTSTAPSTIAAPGEETGSCPVSLLLSPKSGGEKILTRFRDTVLAAHERGINYTKLYYINSPEITLIILTDDVIKAHAQKILYDLLPVAAARLKKREASISQRLLDDMDSLINEIARSASPALKDVLRMAKSDLIKKTFFEELKIRVVP
jgi:hypothetical protein